MVLLCEGENMNQPDRATLKQVAYLTYLGVPNAEHLTKQEASDRINTLLETEEVKRKNWVSDRLNLHPQLYDRELAEELSNSLHNYVRSRVVGASDDLTKKKIEAVVFALTKNDGHWWQQPNHKSVFFERLRQMYPGCCDGHAPERLNNLSTIIANSDALNSIEDLKEMDNSPTPRQIMVLRFWNRMDLANRSRGEIVDWLEHFYAQDSRRKSAWQLYKLQNKDDGTQRDPSWVKIGEGENCLRDLIAWRKKAGLIFLGVVVVIVVVVIVIVCFSRS